MPDLPSPIVVLSCAPWSQLLIAKLRSVLDCQVIHIDSHESLNYDYIASLSPQFVFATHWRHFIPSNIFNQFEVVVFHMTDLPFGRGGSPLQNLILRGHTSTVISAIKCAPELDSGDIYLQKPLSLYGSAEEIYIRADRFIEEMIVELVSSPRTPLPQSGTPVYFTRRQPSDSDLQSCSPGSLPQWYDHIRMLDAEGYPHSFLKIHGMHLEFRRVSLRNDGLHADVIIRPLDTN